MEYMNITYEEDVCGSGFNFICVGGGGCLWDSTLEDYFVGFETDVADLIAFIGLVVWGCC